MIGNVGVNGDFVGDAVGYVGSMVGDALGSAVDIVGETADGFCCRRFCWFNTGKHNVGSNDGYLVGVSDGATEGFCVGYSVDSSVGSINILLHNDINNHIWIILHQNQ